MSWEIKLLLWLQQYIPFKSLWVLITHLGDSGLIWIMIGLYIGLIKNEKKKAAHVFIALALVVLFVNIFIKNLVKRGRPFSVYPIDLLINTPSDYSFPSGHTASSFGAAYVLAKSYPKYAWVFYLLAALIAFSRMVLFVHYPTDILAGLIIGLICGMISMKAFKF